MIESACGLRLPEMILLALLFLGLLGRSNLLAISACILLCIRCFNLDSLLLPLLEQRGLEIGLLLLMLHILSPIATDKLTVEDLKHLVSGKGFFALVSGALATKLNSDGLNLMNSNPEIIFGMTIGTVLGILVLKGTPCGPVMAAAVTAVFIHLTNLLKF